MNSVKNIFKEEGREGRRDEGRKKEREGRREEKRKGGKEERKQINPQLNKSAKTQNTNLKSAINFRIATAFPSSMIHVLGFHFGQSMPIMPVQSWGRTFSDYAVSESQGTGSG